MKSSSMRFVLAGLVVTVFAVLSTEAASAQCSTCPTPTVAYQPVVAQTTVAYQPYTGWYPGKLLDRMRLRQYGVAPTVAPTYTASYAPYTTSYTPYTAGYAPYTAAYRPYVTSYAPLVRRTVARPIVQTSYYVPAVVTNSCQTCVQTVARQVVLSPIVTSGCNTCSTGVAQASYAEPACSSCTTSSAVSSIPSYPAPAPSSGGVTVGPNTGQPGLRPDEQIPGSSNYPPASQAPDPAPESSATESDPFGLEDKKEPADETVPSDSSTLFEAPRLLDPRDRTAQRSSSSRVSVDVWNAVYNQPVTRKAVSQTSYKPTLSQVNNDADGWSSVPRSR
ncbi:MAG: hypothetical protein GXP26_01830 [Planctomycetes bacterium]|nr:hypothetical protein [Planctomycetota bacterium]